MPIEPQLLSDEALAEIEEYARRHPLQPWMWRVSALCQTVRAAWKERDDALCLLEGRIGVELDNATLRDQLAQVADNIERPVRNVLETCLDEGDPNPKPLHDLAYVVAVKLGQAESRLAHAAAEQCLTCLELGASDAATRMREACAAALETLRDESGNAVYQAAYNTALRTLQSLTLDQVEQKQ